MRSAVTSNVAGSYVLPRFAVTRSNINGPLGHFAQRLRLRQRGELPDRPFFYLARALARDAEHAGDFVERAGLLAAEAPAQLDDAALAIGEVLERLPQAPVH